MKRSTLLTMVLLLAWLAGTSTLPAQGTNAFTYQGRLDDGANLATGLYDLRFTTYNAASGGSTVAGPLTLSAVGVNNGLFTVMLDFGGSAFTGPARWLGIEAKTNGAASFTALSPRQQLTPAPYAIMANSASNLLGTLPAAQLAGTVGNGQLANNSVTVNAGTGLSGGGVVALGGSTTLTNAGVLTVTGNADITASPTSGSVGLSTTATDANTASRIVKRDASGNFSAGSVALAGNLNLPATTATAGAINSGGNRLLHAYGTQNTFVGPGAGNFTMGNANNTGIGYNALNQNNTGFDNTANGAFALNANTSGKQNTALGYGALYYNTNGSDNIASGMQALYYNTSGSNNIALGRQAGYNLTTGSGNIDIGNLGNAGEYKRIRIGTQGTQTNTFIAGIYEATVASGTPVYVDSTGQLGTGGTVPPAALANAWKTTGNASTTAANFIGTTDTNALEFKVNNARVMRIEPGITAPNLVGGYSANTAAGADGAVIAGGGSSGLPNTIIGPFSFIGGGRNHTIEGGWGFDTIGGGNHNRLQDGAGFATIAGGGDNAVGTNSMYVTIGGGHANTIQRDASQAAIGGGEYNSIGSNALHSVIAGGSRNTLGLAIGNPNNGVGALGSVVGGGISNTIEGWTKNGEFSFPSAQNATIAGGLHNRVGSYPFPGEDPTNKCSTIGGGQDNLADSSWCTVAGGNQNSAAGEGSSVAGGKSNASQGPGGGCASVGGGCSNVAAKAYSTIPGGMQANTDHYGQLAYASGAFRYAGDAQASLFVLRGTSTNSLSSELFLDGVSERMTVPVDTTWTFDILVTARAVNGSCGGWHITGVIKNKTVTGITLVGSPAWTALGSDYAGFLASVAADGTHDALVINVTGGNGWNTVIRWVATVRTAEVVY